MPTIYQPKGQAGEYSAWAANPFYGCGHKCAYCYVPNIPGQPDRKTFDEGAILKPNYLAVFEKEAQKMRLSTDVRDRQVMISFTSDPFAPFVRDQNGRDITADAPVRKMWQIMIENGFAICALTKGGTRALRDLDLFRPDRDAFASTLTSLDPEFSQKWERGAALPHDRIAALQEFHKRGIFTWVSLEPTIDVEASLSIVDATHEFVDLYKVGRVNYLKITKTTDWRDYTLRMIDKLQKLGKAHYIKKDLQPYLPPGYHNPLRVPQHH